MLGRTLLLLRIAFPLLAVAGTGAAERPPVSADALPPPGGNVPPGEGFATAPGKGMRLEGEVKRA